MPGAKEKIVTGGEFHDLAPVDHRDPVAEMRRDAHVPRNEQHGTAAPGRELTEHGKDLALHRDIQPAGRVVRHDKARRADQCDRNDHTLCHAAAELMRKRVHSRGRIRNLHRFQHLQRHGTGFLPPDAEMHARNGCDLIPDRKQRVQFAPWIGHDHRQGMAAQTPDLRFRHAQDVAAFEQHAPGGDPARRRRQPQQGARQGGLSGPGLADEADDLAGRDGQVEPVDGDDRRPLQSREFDNQALHRQGRTGRRFRRGTDRRRRMAHQGKPLGHISG